MPADPTKTAGNWVIVSVKTIISWPEKKLSLKFRNKNLWLLPGDKNLYHAVAIECASERLSQEDAYELIFNFLSAMAWARGQSVEVYTTGGGSIPFRTGGGPKYSKTKKVFRGADNLQYPQNEKARLALALYREALGLENTAYQFLGFYKIINILFERSAPQKTWINKNCPKIKDNLASERVVTLQKNGEDVGHYLFESGRCAVAHAWGEPIVNPDRFEDYRRLSQDIRLIRGLAELIIEREFGVKSSSAIYREHLYELGGFKRILGDDFVARLKNKQLIPRRQLPPLPQISIRLRGEEKFNVLEGLTATFEKQKKGMLIFSCHSKDGLFEGLFALDFPEERLRYSFEEYEIVDNGTETPFLHAAEVFRFKAKLIANGEFEVWDSEKENLLGRADPLIPTNIMITPSVENFMNIADQYEKEATERKKAKKAKTKKKKKTKKAK